MNDITIFLYLVFFVAVFAATFAYMFQMIGSTLKTFDNTPTRSYGDAMRPYKIPAPHPEMEGIKYGEELLVFHPEEEDDEDEGDGDVPAYVGENI
mgnify:CR=1 FL=1|tara:strand:- start:202 stop:486 length:285 start_codon:yes stop_codon:yes gene_type:complete